LSRANPHQDFRRPPIHPRPPGGRRKIGLSGEGDPRTGLRYSEPPRELK
jgi:hypothetical protein